MVFEKISWRIICLCFEHTDAVYSPRLRQVYALFTANSEIRILEPYSLLLDSVSDPDLTAAHLLSTQWTCKVFRCTVYLYSCTLHRKFWLDCCVVPEDLPCGQVLFSPLRGAQLEVSCTMPVLKRSLTINTVQNSLLWTVMWILIRKDPNFFVAFEYYFKKAFKFGSASERVRIKIVLSKTSIFQSFRR